MPAPSYQREQEIALRAVREAAGLCRTVQAGIAPDVLQKKDRSPVTVADFGSQALICRTLRAAFPDDPIIAEEDSAALRAPNSGPGSDAPGSGAPGGAALLAAVTEQVRRFHPEAGADTVCRWIDHGNAGAYSERFWTLDPIDGTKGFLRGEQYAIALALIIDGEIAVAALACPNLGTAVTEPAGGLVFTAVRGHGAMCLPLSPPSPTSSPGAGPGFAETQARPAPVRVSDRVEPALARICESVESGHTAHDDSAEVAGHLGIGTAPVRLDSQAKYAVVARGEADIYLRLPTRPGYVEKIWDHAAGVLVVIEAGGRATDIHGKPLDFRHGRGLEQNRGVIVTNGHMHDRVLEALRAAGVA